MPKKWCLVLPFNSLCQFCMPLVLVCFNGLFCCAEHSTNIAFKGFLNFHLDWFFVSFTHMLFQRCICSAFHTTVFTLEPFWIILLVGHIFNHIPMLLVHVLTKSRLGVACFSTDITGMGEVHVDLHVVLQPVSTLAFISAFATDNTAPNVAVLFNQSLNSFFEFGKIVNSFNLLGILGLLNLRLD